MDPTIAAGAIVVAAGLGLTGVTGGVIWLFCHLDQASLALGRCYKRVSHWLPIEFLASLAAGAASTPKPSWPYLQTDCPKRGEALWGATFCEECGFRPPEQTDPFGFGNQTPAPFIVHPTFNSQPEPDDPV